MTFPGPKNGTTCWANGLVLPWHSGEVRRSRVRGFGCCRGSGSGCGCCRSPKARKKISPSTMNRNERRRQEFLSSKEAPKVLNPSQEVALDSKATHSSKISVSCDQCGHKTKTENGMKLHKKNKHAIQQIDGNSSLNEFHCEDPVCEKKETQTVESGHPCEKCEYMSSSKSDLDKM